MKSTGCARRPTRKSARMSSSPISIAGMTPVRQMFLDHPREALECLIEEVRFYWQQALEPYWPQLASLLENDILFRARALALYGIDSMFTDLSDRMEYRQGEILIHKESQAALWLELSTSGRRGTACPVDVRGSAAGCGRLCLNICPC